MDLGRTMLVEKADNAKHTLKFPKKSRQNRLQDLCGANYLISGGFPSGHDNHFNHG